MAAAEFRHMRVSSEKGYVEDKNSYCATTDLTRGYQHGQKGCQTTSRPVKRDLSGRNQENGWLLKDQVCKFIMLLIPSAENLD